MAAAETTWGPPPENPTPNDEEMRLALLLVQLTDGVKQTVRHLSEEAGLSVAQVDVLRQLLAHGPTPMSRLADTLHCEASNLTGLVDRLESRGLVERLPDPGDRRVRVLALTEDGIRTSNQAWYAVVRGCPLSRLDPDERSQLEGLLSKALHPGGLQKEFSEIAKGGSTTDR